MSIVITKKCVPPPEPVTEFDSGIIGFDPAYDDLLTPELITAWEAGETLGSPFHGCADDYSLELPASEGKLCYVGICSGSSPGSLTTCGTYVLPLNCKPGTWTMRIEFSATTSRDHPIDGLFTYFDVYLDLAAEGFGGFGLTPPPLPDQLIDGGDMFREFECDIPYLDADNQDPCDCGGPTRLDFVFAPSSDGFNKMVQAGNLQITGSWLSDFPP